MVGLDPTEYEVTLWWEPQRVVAAMNLSGLRTRHPQDGPFEARAPGGAIEIEPCPSSHPVMCLNVALAKKAGRVLEYREAARPDLMGEPCRLPIELPHAAVLIDDDTCAGVVEETTGYGALVTLRGSILRRGHHCRSIDPRINRALSSWLWLS